MWFGILTPGEHPSRPAASPQATVLGWSARDRRRFDGPLHAVHGGLRVMRRELHHAGVASAPPRCFVCRRPVPFPDPDLVARKRPIPALHGLAEPFPPPPSRARFVLVLLRDLVGSEDPALDEPAQLVVPHAPFAMPLPLESLPQALRVLEHVLRDQPEPACTGCGAVLPGGAEQRAALEPSGVRHPLRRRARRSHDHRAA